MYLPEKETCLGNLARDENAGQLGARCGVPLKSLDQFGEAVIIAVRISSSSYLPILV